MNKCFSCGSEKDIVVKIVYPYPEDDCLRDDPIPQLLVVECEGNQSRLIDNIYVRDFRAAVICHDCYHRLVTTIGVDSWIGQKCWESLNPIIPFARLPIAPDSDPTDKKWDARNYEPLP